MLENTDENLNRKLHNLRMSSTWWSNINLSSKIKSNLRKPYSKIANNAKCSYILTTRKQSVQVLYNLIKHNEISGERR